MAVDKKTFLKNVTVLIDTREQENKHILLQLDTLNIKHEPQKLDIGDYSFRINDRDFSLSCIIERKANVNELYGNITHDRGRIEKEFESGSRLTKQFVLLIENCASWDKLKDYKISDRDMARQQRKVQMIGAHCYSTLQSWQCSNRYKFRTLFVKDNTDTAKVMLEQFYYYWRNYKELTSSRIK